MLPSMHRNALGDTVEEGVAGAVFGCNSLEYMANHKFQTLLI